MAMPLELFCSLESVSISPLKSSQGYALIKGVNFQHLEGKRAVESGDNDVSFLLNIGQRAAVLVRPSTVCDFILHEPPIKTFASAFRLCFQNNVCYVVVPKTAT